MLKETDSSGSITEILWNEYNFFDRDSLHARLNSHYKAWSSKKKKHKKAESYRTSVQKEPTVKKFLLILDLKPLKS